MELENLNLVEFNAQEIEEVERGILGNSIDCCRDVLRWCGMGF